MCCGHICHPRKPRRYQHSEHQYDGVRDARQHVQSRIPLIVSFSTKSSSNFICYKHPYIAIWSRYGGSTYRQIAWSSSEGRRCSGLGTIEDHVSISRTNFQSLQKLEKGKEAIETLRNRKMKSWISFRVLHFTRIFLATFSDC